MGEVMRFSKSPDDIPVPPVDTLENFQRPDEELWALRDRLQNMQTGLEVMQSQARSNEEWKLIKDKRDNLSALIDDIPTRELAESISEEKFWSLMNRAKKILGEEVYEDNVLRFSPKNEEEAA
jgi:hypothetical protein